MPDLPDPSDVPQVKTEHGTLGPIAPRTRFVIAFGKTVWSLGLWPPIRIRRSSDFVVLFGPDRDGQWS